MITIVMTATVTDAYSFRRKKDGTPRSAASPKQMICRFVRFKKILVFTRERSRGMFTNDAILPPQCALKIVFESDPVLNSVKQRSTV